MALQNKRKILLWFHKDLITQAQVIAIGEAHAALDVRFRKVVRDVARDILEDFDALGGDVPQRYLNQAALQGAAVYGKNNEVLNEGIANNSGSAGSGDNLDEAGVSSVQATKGTKKTAAAGQVAPAPSDAPTAPPTTTVAPPAAPVNTSVPPPAAT